VRRAIIANMLIIPPIVPFILERSRDIDFRVRKQVFEQTKKEIDMSHFTIDQRKSVLKNGLYDR
jgi:hypothetical protein